MPFRLDPRRPVPYLKIGYDLKLGINSQFVYQYQLNGNRFLLIK